MNADPISLWMWVPTAQNPPYSHLFALHWCPHIWGRFTVCLNLQLCPVPSPSTVCTTAFPFEVFHTSDPSLSCLMGKSSSNAASETQTPITYGESKCLHPQNQTTSVPVASWRMPPSLPRYKVTCPWQIRGARHTGM